MEGAFVIHENEKDSPEERLRTLLAERGMILNDEDFQDFVQTDRGQTMLTQIRRIIKEEAALREENGEIVNEISVNSSNRKHNVVKKGKPEAVSKEQLLKARELFKSRGLADVTDAQIMEILRSKKAMRL